MSDTLIPVILSGGVGSRLWPLSRAESPKQFIRLPDGNSLIQKAFVLAASLSHVDRILTVCNTNFLFRIEAEYKSLYRLHGLDTQTDFILEPFGRNTAPAIAAAALWAEKNHGQDAVLLVLPSDHLIKDQLTFSKLVKQAVKLAQQGKVVTFGIQPTRPETGYGYIAFRGNEVERFVEKPDLETAGALIESGQYLWNAGMFCFRVSTMLDEMAQHCPDILDAVKQCLQNTKKLVGSDSKGIQIGAQDFSAVPEESIDYAVMEKTSKAAVVKSDIFWDDIGNWQSFGKLMPQDAHGNHVQGRLMLHDAEDCIIRAEDNRLVSVLGVKNLVIVDTPDAVLVADKAYTQEVRRIYAKLKKQGDPLHTEFLTVQRPWGAYTTLDQGPGYKVKRIEVHAGGKLSLQSHKHRSEHWTVVQGVATVTNNDEVMTLQPSDTTYIACGNKHRLENNRDEPIILIELQLGNYLGEDDIIRYDDIYGRHSEQTVK